MQIVILAGGLATRLGELTRSQPKAMLMIQGRPFVEYQLELLRKQGIRDIVMCIGHLGERIERYLGNGEKYGIDIRYSREDVPLGTGGLSKKLKICSTKNSLPCTEIPIYYWICCLCIPIFKTKTSLPL